VLNEGILHAPYPGCWHTALGSAPACGGPRLQARTSVQIPQVAGPPSLEFRSNFLRVVARDNVDIAPTNVDAGDRASCTPSRGRRERVVREELEAIEQVGLG